ncbi:MAG: HEAT repeat domain-containing protein [Bryobacterales bacterium]|nr:HEAT repeat domain-containing protein [Bryobacteraceae bacterium]MDW8131796.1 HEAT repeat domain-containing protein [Bryobacterales bacterium]
MGRPIPALSSQQEFKAYLEELLRAYDLPRSTSRSELRDLLNAEPARFCAHIGQLAGHLPEEAPVRQFLASLLASYENLPRILADPSAMGLREAVALARWIARSEPLLDSRLARWLLRGLGSHPDPEAADPVRILRILDILGTISESQRTVPTLVQLLRHRHPRVRSKAALLAGRSLKSGQWAQQWLTEADPRVRANIVEALWGIEAPGVVEVFKMALRDPHNRVVGNALVGLYMMGDPTAAELLIEMARHKSPSFRATAAWAMGYLEDSQFLPTLGHMMRDPEPLVRRNVLRALARIKKATNQALGRLPEPSSLEEPQQGGQADPNPAS